MLGDTMSLVDRHARLLAMLLVLIASLRIAATWTVFSLVTDEGLHIACGMEWLDRHTYLIHDEQPPLARAAVAVGPYLLGIRSFGESNPSAEGAAIVLAQGKLERNLAAARAGTLPFFWIACAAVFLWAKNLLGPSGGIAALLTFTNTPTVLAHASLATTDMALTAMLMAALLAAILWLTEPSPKRAVWLGLLGGLAIASKFSSLPFFAVAMACMALWHLAGRPRFVSDARWRHAWTLALSIVVASLTVWSFYGFSVGPVPHMKFRLPAPALFTGLESLRMHNDVGQLAYLLGRFSQTGFRSYYPIAFGVKTPIAHLALLAAGIVACILAWRKTPALGQPFAAALGILGFSMVYSRINIGVRHILPVYAASSIVAGAGLLWLLRWRVTAAIGLILMAWLLVSSASAHPDYLAYFNEAAGSEPERILIDSDLDWGQDMKRLAVRLQELKVREVAYLPLIFLQLSGVPFPSVRPLDLEHPLPGWNAAHITALKLRQADILARNPRETFWTDEIQPVERVGKGILLWNVPEAKGTEMAR